MDTRELEAFPSGSTTIEVRVAELRQLFNSMDPAPFRDRDLDPSAHEFIVAWARELPRNAPLNLRVHLDRSAGQPDEEAVLGEAIHRYFAERSDVSRRRLRQLFHLGRISLVIGLGFLGASLGASQLLENWTNGSGIVEILRESLLIGGWVAMWRPLEVFLYDWWPIRVERKLFERLAAMPVRIVYAPEGSADAWRRDWPAAARTA